MKIGHTVENSMAPIQTHFVLETLLALPTMGVLSAQGLYMSKRTCFGKAYSATSTHSGVSHPPVSLHERSRSEVLILVPPVGRARRRAAGAENTFVETIEFLAVLDRLKVFAYDKPG